MDKHQLRFFFDYGGYCLWGIRGGVKHHSLPISASLISELDSLTAEFDTSINWDDPRDPSPWTQEHKVDFLSRANEVYNNLKNELGYEFEIINEVNKYLI